MLRLGRSIFVGALAGGCLTGLLYSVVFAALMILGHNSQDKSSGGIVLLAVIAGPLVAILLAYLIYNIMIGVLTGILAEVLPRLPSFWWALIAYSPPTILALSKSDPFALHPDETVIFIITPLAIVWNILSALTMSVFFRVGNSRSTSTAKRLIQIV